MSNWKTYSYLKTGLSHEKRNLVCQDSVRICETPQYIVAAIADGLGSLQHSALAAQTVTATFCDMILHANQALFSDGLARGIVEVLQKAVREKAVEQQLTDTELDCTFAFVVLSKQHNNAIVGRLGDSAVCLITSKGGRVISDCGALANATAAILDKNAASELTISKHDLDTEKIIGFILTSDGLDNEIYNKGYSQVCKAAERYFNAVSTKSDPGSVIEPRIQRLTNNEDSPFDDDISLAILSRAEKSVIFPDDPTWLCTCGKRNYLSDTYCSNCGADFTILYSKVRFSECGGKEAFFQSINGKPDAEQKLLADNIGKREADATSPSGNTVRLEMQSCMDELTKEVSCKPKFKESRWKLIPVLVIAVLVFIVLMALVVGSTGRHTDDDGALVNKTESIQATSEPSTQETLPPISQVPYNEEQVAAEESDSNLQTLEEIVPPNTEDGPDEIIPGRDEGNLYEDDLNLPEATGDIESGASGDEVENGTSNQYAEKIENGQEDIYSSQCIVTSDYVSLRAAPGLDTQIYFEMNADTILFADMINTMEKDNFIWIHVKVANDETGEQYEGWVCKDFIQISAGQ